MEIYGEEDITLYENPYCRLNKYGKALSEPRNHKFR